MEQKKNWTTRTKRWLAFALCAFLLAAAAPLTVAAETPVDLPSIESTTAVSAIISQPEPTTAIETTQSQLAPTAEPAFRQADPEPLSEEPADSSAFEIWINEMFDAFWAVFNLLGYMLAPREGLVYNIKDPFQKLFGFNEVYEFLQPVAFVFADTIRCKFTYEGRDWLLQLWKGAYAFCICTGGEIGLYNKPTSRNVEHYDCAREEDWIGMEMTIYNEGEKLFTRPFDEYWWITGYKFDYLDGFLNTPRTDCTMEARLQLEDAEMASLVAAELDAIGFTCVDELNGLQTPDCYAIEGDTIRLVWQTIAQNAY